MINKFTLTIVGFFLLYAKILIFSLRQKKLNCACVCVRAIVATLIICKHANILGIKKNCVYVCVFLCRYFIIILIHVYIKDREPYERRCVCECECECVCECECECVCVSVSVSVSVSM